MIDKQEVYERFLSRSIIDNDLYKFTMQQAVLHFYPEVVVTYRFNNRGKQRFNKDFMDALEVALSAFSQQRVYPSDIDFMKDTGLFKDWYLAYLSQYKYNINQIKSTLTNDGDLEIEVGGTWHSTILWEVPLMALISELYFSYVETDWKDKNNLETYELRTREKFNSLVEMKAYFAEFGTRRRRDFDHQRVVNETFTSMGYKNYVGTSNVFFAKQNGVKPIGTMAHEWIMGISALSSLRYANRDALYKWQELYQGKLGVALTDTFGTDAFIKDFDLFLSKSYDGTRHDSGDPVVFGNKMINHYDGLSIDPRSKSITFSDGLNLDEVWKIQNAFHFGNKIKTPYGIGTFLTNDIPDSKALNMVIKLRTVNGVEVVKLSDVAGKETGDEKAIDVAKWTFNL